MSRPVGLPLRYGMNPHQDLAWASGTAGPHPFRVINGEPSLINMLDALNSWQLVRELSDALRLPAAASFKHVSPSGAAVGLPLSHELERSCRVEGPELTPLAAAYARARGTDRLSSYGDWVAVSEPVDLRTAELLTIEVSDGIIAPGFEPGTVALLARKKRGAFVVLEMDPVYEPPELECRDVFGVRLEQQRDRSRIGGGTFANVVTSRGLSDEAIRDLTVATIAVKYTQSNSVCLARDGQVIGVGASQQSRIACTRLAAEKAELWWLRQHPTLTSVMFDDRASRSSGDNVIDALARGEDLDEASSSLLASSRRPELSRAERAGWLSKLDAVSMASDGLIPFRDTIDQAARTGVEFVAQPGGSLRDGEVMAAADEQEMAMALTGVRLFTTRSR